MGQVARGDGPNAAIAQHNEEDEIGNELLMLLFFLESNNQIRETDPLPSPQELLKAFRKAHPHDS